MFAAVFVYENRVFGTCSLPQQNRTRRYGLRRRYKSVPTSYCVAFIRSTDILAQSKFHEGIALRRVSWTRQTEPHQRDSTIINDGMNTSNNGPAASATDAVGVDENSRGRQVELQQRRAHGRLTHDPIDVLASAQHGRANSAVVGCSGDGWKLSAGDGLTDARADVFIIETDSTDAALKSRSCMPRRPTPMLVVDCTARDFTGSYFR